MREGHSSSQVLVGFHPPHQLWNSETVANIHGPGKLIKICMFASNCPCLPPSRIYSISSGLVSRCCFIACKVENPEEGDFNPLSPGAHARCVESVTWWRFPACIQVWNHNQVPQWSRTTGISSYLYIFCRLSWKVHPQLILDLQH